MTCPSRPRRSALLCLTPSTARQQIDAAARLVARHLILRHSPEALIATLAHALLREDAGFHAYQMLDAGVRQFREWGNCERGPTYSHCRHSLSSGPFANPTRAAADGRHRSPADARQRASP